MKTSVTVEVDRPDDPEEYGTATISLRREDDSLIYQTMANSLAMGAVEVDLFLEGRSVFNGIRVVV